MYQHTCESRSHALAAPTGRGVYGAVKIRKEDEQVRVFSSQMMRVFPHYWRYIIKHHVDVVCGAIGLICALPLMSVIALLVTLTSRGPIVYTQERVGLLGKRFMIYKFRTMYSDAEKQCGPVWAQAHDSRITPFGRFLRASHLDELPQLFNVIKGEMSIVGPRPERPFFVEQLKRTVPQYEKRLCVMPGITGLAQVRHKYDETVADVKHKIKYDLLYIEKMCLMLDAKVLLWTVGVVVSGKAAKS